jgi:hypothetical protein
MRKYVRASLNRFCLFGKGAPFVSQHKSRVKHEVSALGANQKARFNAQVTEWLMVADCKSAALRSYGGSNPPLCTRLFFELM